MGEAIFKGQSGKLYRLHALRPNGSTLAEPAVYAFARPGPGLKGWTPVFLSRTGNLAERLQGHERWEEARLLGATHVLALFEPEREARASAEADLIEALRPVLNLEPTLEESRGGPERILAFMPRAETAAVRFDPPIPVGRRDVA